MVYDPCLPVWVFIERSIQVGIQGMHLTHSTGNLWPSLWFYFFKVAIVSKKKFQTVMEVNTKLISKLEEYNFLSFKPQTKGFMSM